MKIIFAAIAGTAFIFTVLSANSASETTRIVEIPNDLIVAKLKKRDPLLAISVDAILYKIRQNQNFTLVDVRSKQEFERLYIPGSVNILLYAGKTRTYLTSFLSSWSMKDFATVSWKKSAGDW